MAALIDGAKKVSDLNQAQLVLDMEANAAWLDEDSYLFETITRKTRKNGILTATRMKHEYRERRLMAMTVTTTAAVAAGVTSIPTSDSQLFRTNHLVFSPETGEMFAMDEDIGGTAVAGEIKVRKLDSASGTGIVNAITANSILVNLQESHAEGDPIPAAYSTTEENFFTFCYQFDRVRENTDISPVPDEPPSVQSRDR